MSFDFSKLRGRIIEKYGSQTAFAKEYGVSENTLSLKMNNKVAFSVDDIVKMCRMLSIAKNDVGDYFFTPKL